MYLAKILSIIRENLPCKTSLFTIVTNFSEFMKKCVTDISKYLKYFYVPFNV